MAPPYISAAEYWGKGGLETYAYNLEDSSHVRLLAFPGSYLSTDTLCPKPSGKCAL